MTWYEVTYYRAPEHLGRMGGQFSRRANAIGAARFNVGKDGIIRATVRRVSSFKRLRPDGKLYQVETVLTVNA